MRKINEIFYSLQGEGHHTGYPSVFVRFSGCNLQCPFCDTRHEEGVLMDDAEIVRAINLYNADWIVLTGGEPSLWIDKEFIHLLKRATGKKIAIETNGTNPLPEGIDWVTVSPKFGISSEIGERREEIGDAVRARGEGQEARDAVPARGEGQEARDAVQARGEGQEARDAVQARGEGQEARGAIRVERADEIKVVDVGQELEPYFSLPCRTDDTLMYLQPCFVPDETECESNRLRTVRRVLADPRWTLSIQAHRYLKIP